MSASALGAVPGGKRTVASRLCGAALSVFGENTMMKFSARLSHFTSRMLATRRLDVAAENIDRHAVTEPDAELLGNLAFERDERGTVIVFTPPRAARQRSNLPERYRHSSSRDRCSEPIAHRPQPSNPRPACLSARRGGLAASGLRRMPCPECARRRVISEPSNSFGLMSSRK